MALSSIGLIFCRSYWLALCLVSLIGKNMSVIGVVLCCTFVYTVVFRIPDSYN